MGHRKEIRKLRQPGTLVQLYQFVNQAGGIVDPTATRIRDVQEQIGWLREAYIDAKQAIDNGAEEEETVVEAYHDLINKFEDAEDAED